MPAINWNELIRSDALLIGAVVLGLLQLTWKVFWEPDSLPTIPLVAIPITMVPSAFAICYYVNWVKTVDPIKTGNPMDAWYIQALVLLAIMLTAWLGVREAFLARRPATPAAPKDDAPLPGETKTVSAAMESTVADPLSS